MNDPGLWLNQRQAAQHISASLSHFRLLVRRGRLPPPCWLGKRSPRWKAAELDAALKGDKPSAGGPVKAKDAVERAVKSAGAPQERVVRLPAGRWA